MLLAVSSQAISTQIIFLLSITLAVFARATRQPTYVPLPPLREQAGIQNVWREERISLIPSVLQKYDADAWLITQREHTEDTAFWSLKRAEQFSARRRTIQLYIAHPVPGTPSSYYWIDNTPSIWNSLLSVLETQNPSSIAINVDSDIAFSGGLHVGELYAMLSELGDWQEKFVERPMIPVEVVATMVEGQLGWYKKMMETTWAMIEEGFSEKVIKPGVTTTEDVEWFLRAKVQQQNYTTWFHPDVEIVTASSGFLSANPPVKSNIIQYGDLLHVDFGVTAMGLNTDTQHLAYVLHPGETEDDIPLGLKTGLRTVNRLQDILRANMKIGLTGNNILIAALRQMRSESIEGKIYSHPIGDWGHSAGTLIGMTNLQSSVPILGDMPLLKNTYYSIELYAESFVPEKNVTLHFYQEEDVYWDEESGTWEWVWGRQEDFLVIRTESEKKVYIDGGLEEERQEILAV